MRTKRNNKQTTLSQPTIKVLDQNWAQVTIFTKEGGERLVRVRRGSRVDRFVDNVEEISG